MSTYKSFLDALKQGKTIEYNYFQDLSDPFNGYYTMQKLCRFTYIPDTGIVAVYESEEVFQDMDSNFGEKNSTMTWEQFRPYFMQYNFSFVKIL